MSGDQITVGPIPLVEIDGDFYGAVHARLELLGRPWSDLATELDTSRQNLERQLRKQRAIRLENVRRVITALHRLAKTRRRLRPLRTELTDLGLKVTPVISEDDAAALLDAAALVRHRAQR